MEPPEQSRSAVTANASFVKAFEAIEARLSHSPLLFVAIFVGIYGYKKEDFSDFAQLTVNPFVTHPDATRQFLHSSPLTLFFGWPLTHLFGAHASYVIVCIGGFALLLLALRLFLRRFEIEHRSALLFAVFSTPILLVLSRWLGKNDAYLVALFLLVLTYRSKVVLSTVFSLLLVLAHKELGTVMLIADGLLRWSARAPILAGAVAGNILVSLYIAALSEPPFSRIDLALSYVQRGISGWENNPVAHLLLGFSWFWILLFARWRTPDFPRVAGVVLLCIAISADGADYTRDFILCAFPVVIYTAEHLVKAPELLRLVTMRPFPLVFLLQMQIESFDQVRDTWWPYKLVPLVLRLLDPAP